MTALKGREAAEILKAEGNAAYQKQKYGAALDVSACKTSDLYKPLSVQDGKADIGSFLAGL
jgi:hypothetical protein